MVVFLVHTTTTRHPVLLKLGLYKVVDWVLFPFGAIISREYELECHHNEVETDRQDENVLN